MLTVENLSAGYNGIDVIRNITFKLAPGEHLAILGPNGCGKSTLLKALTGVINSSGSILLDGKPLEDMNRMDIGKHMAVMSQISSVYFSYSVFETILMGRYIHMKGKSLAGPSQKDKDIALECMVQVGLYDLKDKQINTLSGGQLQRVYLARTLAQDPTLILLDEPTNHLDLNNQIKLIDFLKDWGNTQKRSVIGVLHDINLALRLADYVLVLKDGNAIAYGKTKETIHSTLLKEVYDMDVTDFMIQSLKMWEQIP